MGHDFVKYADRAALYRDPHLNLVRCIMLAVAEQREHDAFGERLLTHLRAFEWLTNGVFTDFRLDELLKDKEDIEVFLKFLNDCATFLCGHGSILHSTTLAELVGDSDQWNCDLPVTYPLVGLGRLANLIVGSQPRVLMNYANVWNDDGISVRLKQQEIIDDRRSKC